MYTYGLALLSNVTLALRLMGYGLITVFVVLGIFILLIKLIVKIFSKDDNEEMDSQ